MRWISNALHSAYARSLLGILYDRPLGKSSWTTQVDDGDNEVHAEAASIKQQLLDEFWTGGAENPESWSDKERKLREIPQYVLEQAPLVHLYDQEEFWPCDIAEHLLHTTPYLNYTPIESEARHLNLTNLDQLNKYGRHVYLHSNDDVEDRPKWLSGKSNIPDSPSVPKCPDEDEEDCLARRIGGRSDAPAVLVTVPKPHGIVDAFWFFFYSYNLGNKVFNVRFGNHIGDWEHMLVRFKHGKPHQVFYSEHFFGAAYTYEAVEKIGPRPVGYSATGTHAMYARPGTHTYILPWGLLHDETSRGPLWDPVLNSHMYTFDLETHTLRSSNATPKAPTQWFDFAGKWGDKVYPLSDGRQYLFAGQYHYVSGPIGPRFKSLGRESVCQGNMECKVRNWIEGEDFIREWDGAGDGEDFEDGRDEGHGERYEEGLEVAEL